jgi:hypothetical protein
MPTIELCRTKKNEHPLHAMRKHCMAALDERLSQALAKNHDVVTIPIDIAMKINTILVHLETAHHHFMNSDARPDTKAREAVRALGFTIGKRTEQVDLNTFLLEYLWLTGTYSMDKWAALKSMRDSYGLQSAEAALQMLKRVLEKTWPDSERRDYLPSSQMPDE